MSRLFFPLMVFAAIAGAFVVGRASGAQSATDPQWVTAGELSRTRAYARAALIETGEILVVGGLDAKDEHVTIPTTELFDPATKRTTVLTQTVQGRLNQTVTSAWGGRVLVAGGTVWTGDAWQSVATTDVYLPWSRTWMKASPMLQPRSSHGAVALPDGRVFVTGGNYNNRLLRSSEIYDPATNDWDALAPLPRARTEFSMALLPDGTIFVAGGFQDDGKLTTSTLLYEPWSDQWVEGPAMFEGRLNHSMVVLPGGDLFFFGGEKSGAGSAERYLWRERRSEYAGALGEPRLVAQGAALPDGRVVAVGGLPFEMSRTHFDPFTNAELWDPVKQAWRAISGAPTKRAYAQFITTERGLYRISGVGENEKPFSTIEELVWY